MLKDFTIANLLDLNETIAKDLFEGKTYPWEVLPEIGDFILKLGQTLSEEEYDHPSEDVWIAKSAKVAPTACINGPVIIGKEAEVRHCAFIRGKAIIGEGAVVGNSTGIKECGTFQQGTGSALQLCRRCSSRLQIPYGRRFHLFQCKI